MRVSEIITAIEKDYPCIYAEKWDNVGLLCGDMQANADKILIALDASDEVIDYAISNQVDLLITHHPLIFSPLKRICEDDFVGARIRAMIKHDISYYAMHTNYDMLRMADLAADIMGWKEQSVLETVVSSQEKTAGFGKVGTLLQPCTLKELAEQVKALFHLPGVVMYGNPDKEIKTAAVCPGSGKSFLSSVLEKKADVYITGDIDYHTGTDANMQGIAIIDAGHYGIEHIFIKDMKEYMEKQFEQLEVIEYPIKHPYMIVS